MIQTLLGAAALVLPVMIGTNVLLSGLGQILGAIHANNAANLVGKAAGGLKALIDLLSANIKH